MCAIKPAPPLPGKPHHRAQRAINVLASTAAAPLQAGCPLASKLKADDVRHGGNGRECDNQHSANVKMTPRDRPTMAREGPDDMMNGHEGACWAVGGRWERDLHMV